MKIFINAIAALQGGGVTYLNQLLKEWTLREDVEVDIYGFLKVDVSLKSVEHFNFINVDKAHKSLLHRFLHEKLYIPRLLMKTRYNIAFFPNGMVTGYVPEGTITITMFRNMLPFSQRDIDKFSSFKARSRYYTLRFLYLRSYKKVDHIIFISRFAQNVIANHLPGITKKASVIPHGIAGQFYNEKAFRADGYILYVSILNEYKHQIEIVKGLGVFKSKLGYAPKLLLAGYIKDNYAVRLKKVVKECHLEDEVKILGPVEYAKLPDLYESARLVLFGSTCENCPNILLEAMATNNAILSSSFQPMPEFLLDTGFYFNPEVPDSFFLALEKIWDNAALLGQKADESFELSKKYSWKKTASTTLGLFEKLDKQKQIN